MSRLVLVVAKWVEMVASLSPDVSFLLETFLSLSTLLKRQDALEPMSMTALVEEVELNRCIG